MAKILPDEQLKPPPIGDEPPPQPEGADEPTDIAEADTTQSQLAELQAAGRGGIERTAGAQPYVAPERPDLPTGIIDEIYTQRQSDLSIATQKATTDAGQVDRNTWIEQRAAEYRQSGRYMDEGAAERQAAREWSASVGGGSVDIDQIGDWQREYIERNPGASQEDAVKYSQEKWQETYGVSEADLVSQGQIMPGVTEVKATEYDYGDDGQPIKTWNGIAPVGAKPSKQVDVDGNPTSYEKDGVTYYMPNSANYKDGYRTSEEYRAAQALGTDIYGGPHEGKTVDERAARQGANIIITKPDGTPMARTTMGFADEYGSSVKGYINRDLYKVDIGDVAGTRVLLKPEQAVEYYKQDTIESRLKYLNNEGIISKDIVDTYVYISNIKNQPVIASQSTAEAKLSVEAQQQEQALKYLIDKGYAGEETYGGGLTKEQAEMLGIDVTKPDDRLYDIAKYIRDTGDTELLELAGFTPESIKEAETFNRNYLGVGAPEYVPTTEFIKEYFADKGWTYYPNRSDVKTTSEIKLFDKRLIEANDAHKAAYAAPMSTSEYIDRYFDDKGWGSGTSVTDYIREYFADKGWDYVDNRSALKTASEVRDYDKKLSEAQQDYSNKYNEARDKYIDKYGINAVALSTAGSTASWLFAPARVLTPGVEPEDISALEWAIGYTQLVTAMGGGGLALKGIIKGGEYLGTALSNLRYGKLLTAVKNILRANANYEARMIEDIGKYYGDDAANAYRNVINNIAQHAENTAKLEQAVDKSRGIGTIKILEDRLAVAKKAGDDILAKQIATQIDNLSAKLPANTARLAKEASANKLKQSVVELQSLMRDKMKYDIPVVKDMPNNPASMFNQMHNDIVPYVENIVKSLRTPKARLTAITKEIDGIKTKLEIAKTKAANADKELYNLTNTSDVPDNMLAMARDAAKKADKAVNELEADLSLLRDRYASITTSSLEGKHSQLQLLREELNVIKDTMEALEYELRFTMPASTASRIELMNKISILKYRYNTLIKREIELTDEITKGLKTFDVEMSRYGEGYGGGSSRPQIVIDRPVSSRPSLLDMELNRMGMGKPTPKGGGIISKPVDRGGTEITRTKSIPLEPTEPEKIIEPTIEPTITPSIEPFGVPSVMPDVEPSLEPDIKTTTVTEIKTGIEPVVTPSVEPFMEPAPAIEPAPIPAPQPQPVPPEEPIIIPTTFPSAYAATGKPPIFIPPKPPLIVIPKGTVKPDATRRKVEPGTVVWIQGRPDGGAMYKILEPPYTDIETTRQVPEGYVDYGYTGENAAKKSIQVLGGKAPYAARNIDLGIARINIIPEDKGARIEYVKDADSNTGERSRTVGMGAGQIPIEAWEAAKAQGVSYKEFIRNYRPQDYKNEVKTADIERQKKAMEAHYDIQEFNTMPKQRTNRAWYEEEITPTKRRNDNSEYYYDEVEYYRGRPVLPEDMGKTEL